MGAMVLEKNYAMSVIGGSGEELCDVCYWRNIAETRLQKINQLEKAGDELLEWLTVDGVSLSNQRLLANQWYRAKGVKK